MLAAFLGIALYAALAGASAGVVRAAIMGGLGVFAAQIGRRQYGLNSLIFVAALMALADPHVLWDVGFQLSFMATLGLILYAEPLSQWFTGLAARRLPLSTAQRLSQPAGEYFLFTLAAQLTTLALILYYFQRLSLVSLSGQPAGAAGPAGGDDPGRAGGADRDGLPTPGTVLCLPGLAVHRLYHPHGGAAGPPAGGGLDAAAAFPLGGAGLLCPAVWPDRFWPTPARLDGGQSG